MYSQYICNYVIFDLSLSYYEEKQPALSSSFQYVA